MKVWITKYALTKGILEKDADSSSVSKEMIKVRDDKYTEYYHGQDWHLNKENAIIRAEKMRKGKLDSLKREIERIQNVKFD
jgi:hypothetical protein